MIMELLSKNLDELMKSNNPKKLSLKSVLMVADQMVKIKFILYLKLNFEGSKKKQ